MSIISLLMPLTIFIAWFFLYYLIILGGIKLFGITGISKSKIFGFAFAMLLVAFFDYWLNPLLGTNKIIIYLVNNLIYFFVIFSVLKYYFKLVGKQIWLFILYLIVANLILSGIISFLQIS